MQLLAISLPFFCFLFEKISLLDPDPGGKMNADPDPQPCVERARAAQAHSTAQKGFGSATPILSKFSFVLASTNGSGHLPCTVLVLRNAQWTLQPEGPL